MTKESIIIENARRLGEISAVYNPITGEGSTSVARQWVRIEKFPIENLYLPASMCNEKFVQELARLGAEGYIQEILNKEINNRNMIKLWLDFCLLRKIGRAHV